MLDGIQAGAEVVPERDARPAAVLRAARSKRRRLSEIAAVVQYFISSHRERLDRSKGCQHPAKSARASRQRVNGIRAGRCPEVSHAACAGYGDFSLLLLRRIRPAVESAYEPSLSRGFRSA